jgi:hypothetical protein
MPESLEPDGTPVFIDDIEVVSPGLTGIIEVYHPGAGGSRGPETVETRCAAPWREQACSTR